jgi:ribonuclease Z
MIEVVLLGTGTPMPDPTRCGSGVAVVTAGRWVLVDCGRGVTQRTLESGLDLGAIDAVVLTHHHSDHVSDLATLAIARWVDGAVTPLVVVAPAGPCARFARHCLDGYEDQAFHSQAEPGSPPRPTVSVHEFAPTGDPSVVFESSPWSVQAALVDHHPIEAAVGYRVEVGGRAAAVSGDTAVCAGIERLARDADVLVHEALRSDLVSPAALAWNAGARSVGALAHALDLPTVVLTHLLPTPATPDDERAFVAEARSGGFTGELIVAHDRQRLTVGAADLASRDRGGTAGGN